MMVSEGIESIFPRRYVLTSINTKQYFVAGEQCSAIFAHLNLFFKLSYLIFIFPPSPNKNVTENGRNPPSAGKT